jgi:hypothetical protein
LTGRWARLAGWGTCNGGGLQAFTSMLLFLKTGDRQCLDTISLNADCQQGANPLSKTFISNVGASHPNSPEFLPQLYKGPNRTGGALRSLDSPLPNRASTKPSSGIRCDCFLTMGGPLSVLTLL